MMMRPGNRKSKLGKRMRAWEHEDTELLLNERRVLFGEEAFLQEYMAMGAFSDMLGGVKPAAAGLAVDDPAFAIAFPQLHLMMTSLVDDDGKLRQVCTLTVVCEDGQVKCGINERNHNLSLWTGCGTLGGAFAALEEALGERPVQWRKSTWKGRK